MLNMVTTRSTEMASAWLAQLQVELREDPRAAGVHELELLEILQRSEGVSSAAVVPLLSGLAVAVRIPAPDAAAALWRARELVTTSARRVGLGEVTVTRVRIVPAPELWPG